MAKTKLRESTELKPVVCDNQNDLFVLITMMLANPDVIERDHHGATRYLLILLHEYLGLVLEEKMSPFASSTIEESDINSMKKILKEARQTTAYKSFLRFDATGSKNEEEK